jgi:pyruvate ferredoxin oxidoreductase alpha subunit
MVKVIGLNGDEVIAYAAKQCKVDVVAAYPITPQTIMVERFSEYVANGEVDTEFICVESEHSAMSACIGASLAGGRVFTGTSSQGLALMHEMLYIASSLRCPIVMAVANRALSAPLNIHCDHSDMMGSRDCGWIQIFAENAQEAYDWTIQAFRLGEDLRVLLPVAVNIDGFTISHALEGVKVLEDSDVDKFLPPRKTLHSIDPNAPKLFGCLALPDYYFEFKRQQQEALMNSLSVLKEVTEEYEKYSGRKYDVLSCYGLEDAEVAIVCLGSTNGTIRSVARKLRKNGKKVGLIKIWLYRPFPTDELLNILKGLKAIAVFDRAISFGAPYGALGSDICAILHRAQIDLKVLNVIYGLGGRDVTPIQIESVFNELIEIAKTGVIKDHIKYLGVRE